MRAIGLKTPGDFGVRMVPALIASLLAFAATGVFSVVTLVVRDVLQAEPESDSRDRDHDA
jgi:hypothetical protein